MQLLFLSLLLLLVSSSTGTSVNYDKALESVSSTLSSLHIKYAHTTSTLNSSRLSHLAAHLVRDKLTLKILTQDKFTFAFTGTSVTAGHDNYFKDSYPMVFKERIGQAFSDAGVQLVVKNVAMGHSPIVPLDMCVETVAGSDPDVVAWEQAMMCPGHQAFCVEIFIRNAAKIPSNPVILIVDAVPDFKDQAGIEKKNQKMFFQHPGLDIREYYKDFGVHSLIAGESVVERDRFPDLMSRERLMVEGKPFTVKKAWHPGPYGHELVGDVISYTYLAILKDALLEAKSCMQTNPSETDLQRKISELKTASKYVAKDLPQTAQNSQEYFLGNPGTTCISSFEPKSDQTKDIKNFVKSPANVIDLRPDYRAYEGTEWAISLWVNDVNSIKNVIDDNRGYLDRKYTLTGNKYSGEIVFQIDVESESSDLYICSPPESWHGKYPNGHINLLNHPQSVKLTLDNQPVSLLEMSSSGPCAKLSQSLPKGSHHLSVTPLLEEKLAISHLIWH